MAGRLGYVHLDTGATYRAVALAFLRDGVEPTEDGAKHVLAGVHLEVILDETGQRILLNGEDVTEEIRRPDVTAVTSSVAALRSVREKLVDEQRRIARSFEDGKGGVVIDGRDIGTVVFPDAGLKVFMIADERVRARRRYEELRSSGSTATLEEVLRDIRSRDEKDMRRAVAPLRKADDALKLDTSELDIAEQVDMVVQAAKERENLSTV